MYKHYGKIAVDQKKGLFKIIGGSLMPTGNGKGAIGKLLKMANDSKVYSFSDLIAYDIIEDSSTVSEGGVGRAVVGDIIAGPFGAVVGAATRKSKNICSSMSVLVTVSDMDYPLVTIPLISKPVSRSSREYIKARAEANQIISVLANIASLNE